MATTPVPSPPAGRPWLAGLLWVAVFSASAAALFFPTLRAISEPRPAPPAAVERHPNVLTGNETEGFTRQLDLAVEGLDAGRVYFPVSDYDCPVTFLLPCAVVRRLTGWPAVGIMNGFTLVAVVLNGVFAYGFLRSVGTARGFACALALAFQGCNFAAYSQHMAHMHNVQLGWLAAVLWATAALCRTPASWRAAGGLGAAMGAQLLSSPSFTVYLTFAALPAFCLGYWVTALRRGAADRRDALRFVARGVAAAAVAAAVASFYLVPRLGHPPRVMDPPVWLPYVLEDYLELLDPSHPSLFLGLPLAVLGVLALNWWRTHLTPPAVACGVAMTAAFVMMLPAVPGTPYWVFYQVVPWFKHLRVPTRFFPIALLTLSGLVGLYLTSATAGVSAVRRRLLLAGLLAALVAGNWLTSDWYYRVELVPLVKRLLGKDSPAGVPPTAPE